ncbi:MAG: hypothetical protein A4S09_05790 [Proteobacteria bacterium SG_bin7]|nr:MAG: hypothetical protein A4S09_05790 [Proteobacteria bacterium SG_bin7]
MTLFLIHCGFYDEEISDGIYEFHVNIPVVASDLEEAKKKVRVLPQFHSKKMHIDGIQKIEAVDGYALTFSKADASCETYIQNIQHRDL